MATINLAPKYTPADVEPDVARRWSDARAFHADPADTLDKGKPPYCIVIPPPNVTAALHMGHALNNTLQDILIRWRRMAGDNAMWMPGTDHAGIATQTVVDKRLQAEGQPALKDYKKLEATSGGGRDQFIAKVQAWKDEYEERITVQLKAMGCSCDWERQRFTMDEICARAVREAFFQLFKDGLIYRGKRLVNWDPATQTALADDEVEMQEIDGHFYYMKYPVVERRRDEEMKRPSGDHSVSSSHDLFVSSGSFVTVATTRPETMLGDTAVAINPRDPRAPMLRGRHVLLPIVGRTIPIIEDDYVVLPDPEGDEKARFSSGFLKVTPAHDPNDYELGLKYKLPMINVMAPDGSISKDHGWPAEEWDAAFGNEASFLLGMDRYEAREAIVEWFRSENLLEDVRGYRHSVGHSYRSHVPIEPYLSDQWYVKVTDDRLRGAALRAMAPRGDGSSSFSGSSEAAPSTGDAARHPLNADWQGKLRFIPERYANTFRGWHENIRDWCISRQLWWGHRIPVWTPGDQFAGLSEKQQAKIGQWKTEDRIAIVEQTHIDTARTQVIFGPPEEHISVKCAADLEVIRLLEEWGWEQDPDVLDTWFSSALWPFSTLGWPEETPALKAWNPGDVLCTAREIITLWVSRMVMMNLYFLDRLPFTDVFIHAMIQDGEGRKMSKSLGNGVDPLDIIHSHGADAMRFTLAQMTTQTQDVRMPVERAPGSERNTSPKFDNGRNFANKLWNAVRFALQSLSSRERVVAERRPGEGITDREGAPPSKDSQHSQVPSPQPSPGGRGGETLPDRWILSRLARTIDEVNIALREFQFNVYAQTLYDFVWRDFCDWYLEAIKPTVRTSGGQQRILSACIDAILRLLHPVMPFITEKLWEALGDAAGHERSLAELKLPAQPGELCVGAAWPVADPTLIDEQAERDFELIQQIVSAIREARTTYKVPPRQKVEMSGKAPARLAQRALEHRELIETLTNCTGREIGPKVAKPADAAVAMAGGQMEIYLHDLIDPAEEGKRLQKRLDKLDKSIQALRGRLGNKGYTEKAPPHLVQQTRDQLAEKEREKQSLAQLIDNR